MPPVLGPDDFEDDLMGIQRDTERYKDINMIVSECKRKATEIIR